MVTANRQQQTPPVQGTEAGQPQPASLPPRPLSRPDPLRPQSGPQSRRAQPPQAWPGQNLAHRCRRPRRQWLVQIWPVVVTAVLGRQSRLPLAVDSQFSPHRHPQWLTGRGQLAVTAVIVKLIQPLATVSLHPETASRQWPSRRWADR